MSARVRVGPIDEFETGDRRLVSVDGTSVGVIYVDGEFYALANECPHQGGPVCTGRIGGKIVAEHEGVGKRTTERITDELAIACPWHGWEYDLETGEHLGNSRVTLDTYEVEIDDGVVFVRD